MLIIVMLMPVNKGVMHPVYHALVEFVPPGPMIVDTNVVEHWKLFIQKWTNNETLKELKQYDDSANWHCC